MKNYQVTCCLIFLIVLEDVWLLLWYGFSGFGAGTEYCIWKIMSIEDFIWIDNSSYMFFYALAFFFITM